MDDLKNDTLQRLTKDQKIGLKHYNALLTKIPHDEITQLVKVVEEQAARIFGEECKLETVGTYRRGKPESNDITILIICKEYERKLSELALALESTEPKFLIDRFGGEIRKNSNGSETMQGIIKLKDEGSVARKIEIKVLPPWMFAFGTIHNTGCDAFVSALQKAALKHGYALSEQGIKEVNKNVDKSKVRDTLKALTDRVKEK